MAESVRDDSTDDSTDVLHQTFELHINYGTETLRRVLEQKLRSKGACLKEHLDSVISKVDEDFHRGLVYIDQYKLMFPEGTREPNIFTFDVSLLTSILLYFGNICINTIENKLIKGLRTQRNKIVHSTITNDAAKENFESSKEYILKLSKTCGNTFFQDITKNITMLEQKRFQVVNRTGDIIKMKHEYFAAEIREFKPETGDTFIPYSRLRLTRCSRYFATVANIEDLAPSLVKWKILSNDEMETIKEEYNSESQSNRLVLIVAEANDETFLRFVKCIRTKHPILADLIEGKLANGSEAERRLKDLEANSVKEAIKHLFVKDKDGEIDSESIHVAVEDYIKRDIQYQTIDDCLKCWFRLDIDSNKACKVNGITWKTKPFSKTIHTFQNDLDMARETEDETTEMSVLQFAEFIKKRFDMIDPEIGSQLQKAVRTESITARHLIKMTKEELKQTFCEYLTNKFGIGVSYEFDSIQSDLRRKYLKTKNSLKLNSEQLRAFDSNVRGLTYTHGYVKKRHVGLLDPVREFRILPQKQQTSMAFIVKEAVRVIAACMNSLQNGSIHFGIKNVDSDNGYIQGLLAGCSHISSFDVDREISAGIKQCFEDRDVNAVLRSTRPSMILPITGSKSFVIEIDIVPFSGNLNGVPFLVHFPPKGIQKRAYFVYDTDDCIYTLDEQNRTHLEELHRDRMKNRKIIENQKKYIRKVKRMSNEDSLKNKITRGSENIIDDYIPLIVLGNRARSQIILGNGEAPFLKDTLKSAKVIFDFDSSPCLRDEIEIDWKKYKKIVVEDKKTPSIQNTNTTQVWMYCNGDTDLGIEPLDIRNWYKNRFKEITDSLASMRTGFPRRRSLVICLVFDKEDDRPLVRFARHCIEYEFKDDRCIVISDTDANISGLKEQLSELLPEDSISTLLHTVSEWQSVSEILNSVFKRNEIPSYKLPCSNGRLVPMSPTEREYFNHIEIVSAEEIEFHTRKMDKSQINERKREEQKTFYRGNEVSWWNFHFREHVCPRRMYTEKEREARQKLEEDDINVVQTMTVKHETGAGGTTAGKYILWKLSQLCEAGYDKPYRCCIVKHLSDSTINQLRDFIFFKDKSPDPVVILVDSMPDSSIQHLQNQLNSLAYKTSEANKLFCLLVVVETVQIAKDEADIAHKLSEEEKSFFELKFKELEGDPEFDVESLVAFNVMRKEFDETYLKSLTRRFLTEVTQNEKQILKLLSLVNTYDKQRSVPQSILDDFHNEINPWSLQELIGKGGVGLARLDNAHLNEIWSTDNTTEAFKLLVIKQNTSSSMASIRIISQMLAKALLEEIMHDEKLTMYLVADSLLNMMEPKTKQPDFASVEFVKLVCSLFKTRQIQGENGDVKTKFSGMIMSLIKSRDQEEVIKLMKKCQDITKDVMVGQQLARFYIHIKEFENAEEIIKWCLNAKPNNSYLLDTYGQIFKSKLQTTLQSQGRDPIRQPKERAEIVNIAFKAIEKFVQSQKELKKRRSIPSLRSREEEDQFGLNISFEMEVFTALHLLESFQTFLNGTNLNNFLAYLNHYDLENSEPFDDISEYCQLAKLKSGTNTQTHIDHSLRFLEEREYQLKVKFQCVKTQNGERLLLKFRERFERFYGNVKDTSKYQFRQGVGLKSLMKAQLHEKSKLTLKQIYDPLQMQFEKIYDQGQLNRSNRRDLLIYLGMTVIRLSKMEATDSKCTVYAYQKLLHLSQYLVELEKQSERPYTEAYLYYAMFHWPSIERCNDAIELGPPKEYENILDDWSSCFENNFKGETNVPKVYYALGKGSIGTDIVDMENIRAKWKKNKKTNENRVRREVQKDNIWRNPFVIERLQRLTGTMDDTGRYITYKTERGAELGRLWKYSIRIRSYFLEESLCNRPVTFFLAFSWSGLRAMDVKEKEKDISLRPMYDTIKSTETTSQMITEPDRYRFAKQPQPPSTEHRDNFQSKAYPPATRNSKRLSGRDNHQHEYENNFGQGMGNGQVIYRRHKASTPPWNDNGNNALFVSHAQSDTIAKHETLKEPECVQIECDEFSAIDTHAPKNEYKQTQSGRGNSFENTRVTTQTHVIQKETSSSVTYEAKTSVQGRHGANPKTLSKAESIVGTYTEGSSSSSTTRLKLAPGMTLLTKQKPANKVSHLTTYPLIYSQPAVGHRTDKGSGDGKEKRESTSTEESVSTGNVDNLLSQPDSSTTPMTIVSSYTIDDHVKSKVSTDEQEKKPTSWITESDGKGGGNNLQKPPPVLQDKPRKEQKFDPAMTVLRKRKPVTTDYEQDSGGAHTSETPVKEEQKSSPRTYASVTNKTDQDLASSYALQDKPKTEQKFDSAMTVLRKGKPVATDTRGASGMNLSTYTSTQQSGQEKNDSVLAPRPSAPMRKDDKKKGRTNKRK